MFRWVFAREVGRVVIDSLKSPEENRGCWKEYGEGLACSY